MTWLPTSSAVSYKIYFSAKGTPAATDTYIALAQPSYTQKSLTNGTAYYYAVSAVTNAGESALSQPVTATPVSQTVAATNSTGTGGDSGSGSASGTTTAAASGTTAAGSGTSSVLSAPTGLTANASGTQITLTWAPVTGAVSYTLYVSTTGTPTLADQKVAGVSSGYVHTNLVRGTTYTYSVTATDAAGESALSIPASATIKSLRTFAYAGAQYTNNIWEFSIEQSSGSITPLTTPSIAAQNLPMITAVTNDHAYLLSANYSSDSVSSFAIDQTSGQLTLVQHTALASGSKPAWVTTHPSKAVAYVADSNTSKISIMDIAADGHLTERGTVAAGSGVTCLVLNASGTVLYSVDQNVDQLSIYDVDATGGLQLARTVAMTSGAEPNAAVLSPNGRYLYVGNYGNHSVTGYSISGDTLTALGADVTTGSGGVYMVSVSPDGKRLYAAMPYGNAFSIHSLDPNTGAIGASSPWAVSGGVNIAFYLDTAYVLGWTSAGGGLPIATYAYSEANGLAATATASLAGYRGLYQLTTVTFEAN